MISRPGNQEADAYYFTYINQVVGEDPLAVIENQLQEPLLAAVSEEKSLHRYAPGKWSMRQALNHVTDTERAFAFRTLWFARGFDTPLPSYDQNQSVATAGADQVTWAAHVDEFKQVRRATISLFRNMPSEGWTRGGTASEKFFTVRAMVYIIAGHFAHHTRLFRERYL